jgi:prepilin-type N-terminal cleavage/methylation domain-containing protein
MTPKQHNNRSEAGFSIIELVIVMTILLVLMGLVATLFGRSLSIRQRESARTDALTAAQAALNVMSREIANSGYDLIGNGLDLNDCGAAKLHFRANVVNSNETLNDAGENVTYFFEPGTRSILRYDAVLGETSIIINRISRVDFLYFDYVGANAVPVVPAGSATSSKDTARVRIRLTVDMEQVQNQVNPASVVLTSDVTLRNSDYILRNY